MEKIVKIHLNKNFLDYIFTKTIKKEDLDYSADIKVESKSKNVEYVLEKSFSIGQNIEQSWVKDNNVNVTSKKKLRSISIGDVLEVDDIFYTVEPIGFKKIEYI